MKSVGSILSILLLNEVVARRLNNLPLVLETLKYLDEGRQYGEPNSEATAVASDDDTCNITTIISKSSGQIKSVNHPDPYPKNCEWTYVIRVGSEHKILLKVLDWDVDTENGDELSIQPISTRDKGTSAESHAFLVSAGENNSTTTTTATFELDNPCCDSAIVKFKAGNNTNNHTGFLLTYQRQDEVTTQAPIGVPGWHQVYLCGMSLNEFNLHEKEFRSSLIDAVEKYSKENYIISENAKIGVHQITINLVAQCPASWPSSSNCLQVNFSVKLEENEVPTELTSEHLEEMWDVYRDTEELIHLGLWEYEIPNVQWLFWFWIGLLCFLSLFFSMLLIIIVKTKLIYYYFLRLKMTNSQQSSSNFLSWQQQNMMTPLFTAENSQRFQFLQNYEKLNNIKPSSSFRNTTPVNAKEGNSREVSDDLDQEDDQHIYQTLTSLFSRATENTRPSIRSTRSRTAENSTSLTLEVCKSAGNDS